MVTPELGFSEAVRARIKELTGNDPGAFSIRDIFPGPQYHETSFEDRVEAIAQSMVRVGKPTAPGELDGCLSAPKSLQAQTDVAALFSTPDK